MNLCWIRHRAPDAHAVFQTEGVLSVINRLVPAATSAVGLFLVLAAVVAALQNAPQPAAVFGALGLAHIGVAFGIASGSRFAAAAGVLVGTVTAALVAAGIAFIVGIESGIGFDLNVAWFAPLNGYATIAVATALIAASVLLVVGGIRGVRRSTLAA
jgi:hypothetical protein